jgi:hypothetical protein
MTFEEEVTWYELPIDMQAQFYKKAEEDSGKVLKDIKEVYEKLSNSPNELKNCFETFDLYQNDLVIGAVDGSRSLSISNRLGLKVAVFSSCALILKNQKRIDEKYFVGSLKSKQKASDATFSHRLSLYLSYLERKAALNILDKVDYLIIDGSFYGFIYSMLRLKKSGLLTNKMMNLLKEVFDLTNKLIESKKVIAVVKRSSSRAIGAWLFLEKNDRRYCDMLDRVILTYLMPEKAIFDYRKLIPQKIGNIVQIYNQVASLALKGETKENILENAKEKAYEPFVSLNLDTKYFDILSRVHVKAYKDVATCEIEHPNLSIDEIIKVVSAKDFFNPVTGLPLILDIVDSLVSLPLGFTEDYVKEIEARIISTASRTQLPIDVIKLLFFNMNPQKK